MKAYRWDDVFGDHEGSLIVIAGDLDEAMALGVEMMRVYHGLNTVDHPAMEFVRQLVCGSEPEVIGLPVAFAIRGS